MKQIIKDYLYLELGIITLVDIICVGLFPVIYIDDVIFAILYFIIPCPLIMLGIYKIVVILYNKINKL